MYKKEKKVQSCHLRSQASLESPPLRVQNRTFPTKNGYQTIEQFNMSLGVQYHQAEKNVYIYIYIYTAKISKPDESFVYLRDFRFSISSFQQIPNGWRWKFTVLFERSEDKFNNRPSASEGVKA